MTHVFLERSNTNLSSKNSHLILFCFVFFILDLDLTHSHISTAERKHHFSGSLSSSYPTLPAGHLPKALLQRSRKEDLRKDATFTCTSPVFACGTV